MKKAKHIILLLAFVGCKSNQATLNDNYQLYDVIHGGNFQTHYPIPPLTNCIILEPIPEWQWAENQNNCKCTCQ